MSDTDFLDPSSALDASGPEAPHDPTKVRRSKDGRPYVKVPCPMASRDGREDQSTGDLLFCHDGRIPGARPGTTKKCPACKGLGDQREVLYTRCTAFVEAMESRNQLEDWKQRVVLIGLLSDPNRWIENGNLIERLKETAPTDREELDRIREAAFEAGEGYVKSQKGTDLHALSEDVDRGLILGTSLYRENGDAVPEVTLQDRADMAAYRRTMDAHEIEVLDVECFVVNDRFRIGGTFDRRVNWTGVKPWVPHGSGWMDPDECCDRPKVLDLKTGRIDYGAGKMAQQLAVYANSENYDPLTGRRSPLDVCPHVGLILHLPQGTGTASLHTVDLVAGYRAVEQSAAVRAYRSESKAWLQPVPSTDPLDFTVNP